MKKRNKGWILTGWLPRWISIRTNLKNMEKTVEIHRKRERKKKENKNDTIRWYAEKGVEGTAPVV